MKFLVLLFVCALAVRELPDITQWPVRFACDSHDLAALTVDSPQYIDVNQPLLAGDYLDATFTIRSDYKLANMWTANPAGDKAYEFFPTPIGEDVTKTRVGLVETWTYYTATTQDKIVFSCQATTCSLTAASFCTVYVHLHIGHLNHWGFDAMNYDNADAKWVTNGRLWFNISRETQMFDGAEILPQLAIVEFPIKLEIKSTFGINLDSDLTVYGTERLKASLLLFKENSYVHDGDNKLDTKFAFSVQYPYMVKNVKWLNPSADINAPGLPTASFGTLTTLSTSTGPEKYIYQSISTTDGVDEKYVNTKQCVTNTDVVKWDGTYQLKVTLECRPETVAWCDVTQVDTWWQDIIMSFTITSNNICQRTLTKDPFSGKISFSLTAGLSALDTYGAPGSFATNYNFVADDMIHFMIMTSAGVGSQILRMTSMELLKFNFTRTSPALATPWDIYTPAGLIGGLSAYKVCDNVAMTSAAAYCKTVTSGFDFPAIGLGFKLEDTTFGLTNQVTPRTFKSAADVKLYFTWLAPTSKRQLQAAESFFAATSTSNRVGAPEPTSFVPQAAAAASNVGTVVGASVGAVVVIAAAVAFLVVRQKRRAENHSKLTETTA